MFSRKGQNFIGKGRNALVCGLCIILMCFCSRAPESEEQRYLAIQRQKVADALAEGVNKDGLQAVSDSIKAGVDTLWVDVSLDIPGNIKYLGFVALQEMLIRAEKLYEIRDEDAYRAVLAEMEECIDVGMYYYGNSQPAAKVGLTLKILRDSFGDFRAYQPSFRFRSGVSVSVMGFFKSHEFEPYREDLYALYSIIGE
ncbi:MAG: hypothetical protein J5632_04690 [Bacteroidales bacterium]|nr:hypothetical protein [Bacteroidales bacterium]